jgi:hypothetical protein
VGHLNAGAIWSDYLRVWKAFTLLGSHSRRDWSPTGPGKGRISQNPDSAKSCNSQKSSKLPHFLGQWVMEDWVNPFGTQGVSFSL